MDHKKLGLLVLSVLFLFFSGRFVKVGHTANLSNYSITISDPRPSFRGVLGSGNTEGSSIVYIDTTPGDYPSSSSAQLVESDVLAIGNNGTLSNYTVASASSESTISLKSVLGSGDADTGDDVISTISSTLTVRFTTASAIANGRFRILVPALTSDSGAADGLPDGGKFDLSTTLPTVTCPSNADTSYDFYSVTNNNDGDATSSAITVDGTDYHSFECAYSGTGGISTAFDGTSNDFVLIDSIINPAPATGHTTGSADTYSVIIQHLNSSLQIIDSTTSKIGVIEAVKVTAEVAPQITFNIIGVAASTSHCGLTTDVATTPASVPFDELSISAFKTAAHALSLSTNALNGYVVTVIENDQLGREGATCSGDNTGNTCIRDAVGDTDNMSHTAGAEWSSTTKKGFAYTLHDSGTTTTEAFAYDGSADACDGSGDCFRQFADAEDGQTTQTVFSEGSVADNDNLYVCYKALPDVTTAAGFYENHLTYRATATF